MRHQLIRMAQRAEAHPRLFLAALGLAAIVAFLALNYAVQVARKPAEVVGLLSFTTAKRPRSTWEVYGRHFRQHSTALVSPELLAALAQAESDGNPHALTPWRWRWSSSPFEWYRPASSAVGLFQMTDPAFEEARRLCIHDHRVVRAGAWNEPDTCWFTGLYTRLLPAHAVELTAAWLHVHAQDVLADLPRRPVPVRARQDLVAAIHLCGPSRAATFARQGFRPLAGERCGTHELAAYLQRVGRLARSFAALPDVD